MTTLKFVDETIVSVDAINQISGNLVIDQPGTAESVKATYKDKKANIAVIKIVDANGSVLSELTGYVCYAGLTDNGDNWRVTLTREVDRSEQRITSAESKALSAETKATESLAKAGTALTKSTKQEDELTYAQLALTELYEAINTTGGKA